MRRRGARSGSMELPVGRFAVGWISIPEPEEKGFAFVFGFYWIIEFIYRLIFGRRRKKISAPMRFLEMQIPEKQHVQEPVTPLTPEQILVGCTVGLGKRLKKSIKQALRKILY